MPTFKLKQHPIFIFFPFTGYNRCDTTENTNSDQTVSKVPDIKQALRLWFLSSKHITSANDISNEPINNNKNTSKRNKPF